jgi:hypothetical protein
MMPKGSILLSEIFREFCSRCWPAGTGSGADRLGAVDQ